MNNRNWEVIKDTTRYRAFWRRYYDTVPKGPGKLTRRQYDVVLPALFKRMAEELIERGHLNLPHKLGRITVCVREAKLVIGKKGKPVGHCISWKETRKLWNSDPDEREKKTMIYRTDPRSIVMVYSRQAYVHGRMVGFRAKESITKKIWENIENGKEYFKYEPYVN